MFKLNNKDTRICKANDNVNNKVTVVVVLISLLLTLNIFYFTEHIPLVSSIIQPVYPSGFIFGREGVRCYVYRLELILGMLIVQHIWEAYIQGVIYRDQINRILQCIKIVQLCSGFKLHEFWRNTDYL